MLQLFQLKFVLTQYNKFCFTLKNFTQKKNSSLRSLRLENCFNKFYTELYTNFILKYKFYSDILDKAK